MNTKENNYLQNISEHVAILNDEVGRLQADVKWVKRIIYYMAGILSVAVGKIIVIG
ncbi:MAG: hypothetical protein ACTSXD_11970 [Candidatus Heimdallarchaeaceae archaeon]